MTIISLIRSVRELLFGGRKVGTSVNRNIDVSKARVHQGLGKGNTHVPSKIPFTPNKSYVFFALCPPVLLRWACFSCVRQKHVTVIRERHGLSCRGGHPAFAGKTLDMLTSHSMNLCNFKIMTVVI